MKALTLLLIHLFIPQFFWFTPSISKQMDLAESFFIEEKAIMTEKEALSNEIDYYKDPKVTYRNHIRSLTGKDLIHICNKIIKWNNDETRSSFLGIRLMIRIDDIKKYALDHPNDIVANEFRFEGIFTCYGQKKYTEEEAIIFYIPKLDRYIDLPRALWE